MKFLGMGPLELVILILIIVIVAVVVSVLRKNGKIGAGAVPSTQARFCPKCGAELPGNATFCTKCGHQLPASAVQQAATPQKAPTNAFNPASIASRVCAVITLIAMFMPWLEIPGMQSLKNYASMFNIKISSDYAYPMYDMRDVTDVLDALSSSNAYTGIQMLFLGLWLVALVLVVIGLIRSFVGRKSTGSLLIGGIFAALVAILWFAAITFLDGEYARQLAQLIGNRVQFFVIPAAVWVTFVAGLASGILGAIGKNKA